MAGPGEPSQGGYISHLPWHRHYIAELNPHLVRLLLVASGFEPPRLRTVCELAFGQGLSIAINAAANPDIRWFGTDLNPDHVAFARKLASGSTGKISLFNQPFTVFCSRDDLPPFDLVAMTGTWSWLPESDWDVVCGFLSRGLSPGGVFCVDYMTLPGQRDCTHVRHLLASFASAASTDRSGAGDRVPAALQAAREFMKLSPASLGGNDGARRLLEIIEKLEPSYIEHEYLNYNWKPQYFSQVAEILARASLGWACSLRSAQHVPDIDLTPRQQSYLSAIPDAVLRQDLSDSLLNQSGRQDIWMRGVRRLSDGERNEILLATRVILVKPAHLFPYTIEGALGDVALARTVYEPLLAALTAHEPLSLADLGRTNGFQNSFDDLIEAVLVLLALNYVQTVNPDPKVIESATENCRTLNATLMDLPDLPEPVEYLASPVTGGGVSVPLQHQLFLQSGRAGAQDPSGYSDFAANYLSIYRALKVTQED